MPLRIYAPIEKGTDGGEKREHADDGMAVALETAHLLGVFAFSAGTA